MSSDIFRDVDEALREDKLKAFWKKWRYVIIAFCAGIVVFVGFYDFYRTRHHAQLQSRSDAWQEILLLPQSEQIGAMADFIASKNDNHAIFARLHLVREQINAGKKDEAIIMLNQIITSGSVIYASLARIEKAIIFMQAENYSEASLTLEPLLEEENTPFRALALYYASLASLYQQNYPTAQALAEILLNNASYPQELKALAQQIHIRANAQNPAQ